MDALDRMDPEAIKKAVRRYMQWLINCEKAFDANNLKGSADRFRICQQCLDYYLAFEAAEDVLDLE